MSIKILELHLYLAILLAWERNTFGPSAFLSPASSFSTLTKISASCCWAIFNADFGFSMGQISSSPSFPQYSPQLNQRAFETCHHVLGVSSDTLAKRKECLLKTHVLNSSVLVGSFDPSSFVSSERTGGVLKTFLIMPCVSWPEVLQNCSQDSARGWKVCTLTPHWEEHHGGTMKEVRLATLCITWRNATLPLVNLMQVGWSSSRATLWGQLCTEKIHLPTFFFSYSSIKRHRGEHAWVKPFSKRWY